jgi:RHS repeat-associated protein
MLLMPVGALSAPTGVGDPADPASREVTGFFEGASSAGAADPRTGAFHYTYTFELPAARGPAQPSLALTYSSSARDREAGYGWGLELPTIERRPMSGNPRFDGSLSDERFFFNGSPLVKVCETIPSCSGLAATETHPSWATGWRYYRLQDEGLFARFYRSSNGREWRVQLKGGAQLEFGPGDLQNPGTEFIDGDPNKIVRWRVLRHVDALHAANRVVYRWERLGTRGLLYLTHVYDTPMGAGDADADYAHHARLEWQTPPYMQTAYADPLHATPDLRLVGLAIGSKTWAGVGWRDLVRTYRLYYADERGLGPYNSNQAPLWHHSFLTKIEVEGRCATNSSEPAATIPPSPTCATLPPTTFEYGGGDVPVGIVPHVSLIEGGPSDLVVNSRVLPDEQSATLVDFNRDGLPDLVQPWESGPHCNNLPGFTSLSSDGRALLCTNPQSVDFVRSARPVLGYVNAGTAGALHFGVRFRHRCMDAGHDVDLLPQPGTSPANLNAGRTTAFFTAQGGATVSGAWSLGSVLWVPDSIPNFAPRPFFAEPTSSEQGGACDLAAFDEQTFQPAWRWRETDHSVDWARAAAPRPGNTGANWFADVDGDGLVDEVVETAAPVGWYHPAKVSFTRRLARGEPGGSAEHPIQIPFFSNVESAPSMTPAPTSLPTFYVDMNGDGLVDLVTWEDDVPSPRIHVRPGDGRGRFACDQQKQPATWLCNSGGTQLSAAYTMTWTGVAPGSFSEDTRFQDVTGDGLADLVRYVPATAAVLLWVNVDGKRLSCLNSGCAVGGIYDDVHLTSNIGHHRVAFADMDADGVDDFVVIARVGVLAFSMSPNGPTPARPGLLTGVRNGQGATTWIDYKTIQALDLEASNGPNPWKHHSRVVEAVVTNIRTTANTASGTTLAAPYNVDRETSYTYRDPAYDRWQQRFDGFRTVLVRNSGDAAVTEYTYWYGACHNDRFWAHPGDTNDNPSWRCFQTSDDEFPYLAIYRHPELRRIVYYIPGTPGVQGEPDKYLWTQDFSFTPTHLYFGDDRSVWFQAPASVRTHILHPDYPVIHGPLQSNALGGDPWASNSPYQSFPVPDWRVLVREFQYDRFGNLVWTRDEGDAEGALKPDTRTLTILSDQELIEPLHVALNLTCTADWQCNPKFITTFGWDTNAVPVTQPPTHVQKVRLRYEGYPATSGDVTEVAGFQNPLYGFPPALNRHHAAAGAAVAPLPPDHSTQTGWHTFASASYDTFGNVVQSVHGPNTQTPVCTSFVYDAAYHELPAAVLHYTNGCVSAAVGTYMMFDRGFGVPTRTTSDALGVWTTDLDEFGRPIVLHAPAPDAPDPTVTTLAARIEYRDSGPIPAISVHRVVGPGAFITSVTLFNAIGEAAATMHQGDDGTWIVAGWTQRDGSGRPIRVARPFPFVGQPIAHAATATGLSISGGSFEVWYDSFGRVSNVFEVHGGSATEMARYSYRPLIVRIQDAEQLKASGPHAGAYTEREVDGHGRLRVVTQQTSAGTLTTRVWFHPNGQLRTVQRQHNGQVLYERHLQIDSLGRLARNEEPNTGADWRYVWDDAGRLVGTSDARGCGKNLYYDGLARLVGEDYSPCLASQPAWSPPNLQTQDGLEVAYRYDSYEPGQMEAEPGFPELPSFAVGKLVSITDRGSHTRLNYDSRNRVRRVSRQLAKPLDFANTGTSPIAQHWFKKRVDYDLGDRRVRATTGVDIPEMLVGGASQEVVQYSPRGLPSAVTSPYGAIVASTTYDPDGAVSSVLYGDTAATSATFARDARRRLTEYQLSRGFHPIWTVSSPTYSLPPASTRPLVLAHFKFPVADIDDVGNPRVIEDHAVLSVPQHAVPIARRDVAYDDLYRVSAVVYSYATPSGDAAWQSPYQPEIAAVDRRPIPLRSVTNRVRRQAFAYDSLGNVTSATDDQNLAYDRGLGTVTHGTSTNGPNQLRAAAGIQAKYDETGNLVELKVERTGNTCPDGTGNRCAQWFAYDWDEVGQLARARRWDFEGALIPPHDPGTLPVAAPTWDLAYAYTGGVRVLKSAKDSTGSAKHTLQIFDSLRLDRTGYSAAIEDYDRHADDTQLFLAGGLAQVFYDSSQALPRPDDTTPPRHMFFRLGDHLGSAAVTIDAASSEMVERTTYQAFGALESDYRPDRWGSFREDYKFTGKEEDIEVGLTYFGARYYQAHLGRWASADPLTIHGLGSDLNPYAYVSGRVMSFTDPLGLWKCPGCGDEVPDDEVHVHPRGWSRRHAEDMTSGSEAGGWYQKNTTPGKRRPPIQPPIQSPTTSSHPSAFRGQLSRIMNQLITAFTNAATDLAIDALSSGVFGQAVAGTGLYAGLETPASERDATYYAALGGLMVIGGELTATGVFSEAEVAAEGLGSMKAGAGIVPELGLVQRALRSLGTVARAMIGGFRTSRAQEEIWELSRIWTKAGGGPQGSDALLAELEYMAKTPTGRQHLEYMRQALQGMSQSGASVQELEYFFVLKMALQAVLR